SLAVKGIYATHLAEVVPRGSRVKLVLGQMLRAAEKLELALMNLDHQCVLLRANRAIASRQLREVGLDGEPNSPAVAATVVRCRWPHGLASRFNRRARLRARSAATAGYP